ncbi:MAG: biopolymer transporter ExbD [Nonlabens sp.]
MNLRGRNKVSPEFSMSSMTDIVFLLLVFFLLTSPSITPQALDLLLPSASGKTKTKAKLTVSISEDGVFYVNADEVSDDLLEQKILDIARGMDKPSIILRGDKRADLGRAVRVMDVANKNNILVVLATQPD